MTLPVDLVVHGHFYQPPREDPWTGEVPEHPDAVPFRDWNERITAEAYRPIAERGTFEHLSFNVGPTLLSWLQRHAADVYERILDADRRTGRAIAQAYGHAILPLCNDRDRRTHVRWGVLDFVHRFGRRPHGMWLPETAVDDATLAVLAEEGIGFTIVAPGQIEATRPLLEDGDWVHHRDPAEPPTDRPLRWHHPDGTGRHVDLVVYDGALSHALAFEAPPAEGIVAAALARGGERGGLVAAATDGETFGHHHRGADEVLHQALTEVAPALGVRVPSLVDLLDARPPTHAAQVRLSAWSCAHGVDRWQADCGCHTGGDPDEQQAWRAPLRAGLDVLRDWGAEVFERRGADLLKDPWAARDAYLGLLLGVWSWEEFVDQHITGDGHQAGVLLDSQRNALLMYTSCGWFFHDLAGIETVQILRYAARLVDLCAQLGEPAPVDDVLDVLAQARSNDPAVGTGADLFRRLLPASSGMRT